MKYLLLIVVALQLCSCAIPPQKTIVERTDYINLINAPQVIAVAAQSDISYWQNKLDQQPNGFLYQQKLAACHSAIFEATGNIEELHKAYTLLKKCLTLTPRKNKSAVYLNLSSLSIKLHRFQDALNYAIDSERFTNEKYGPQLMQFDALMELGRYDEALAILKNTRRADDFDYYVRYAKYQDYIGQLDSAIYYMEAAQLTTDNPKNEIWLKASLGDYYGHNGELEKSYETFLSVLESDPNHLHALKGIAWIAFSHDKDIHIALEIMRHIRSKTEMPDVLLDMAKIMEFQDHPSSQKELEQTFLAESSKKAYDNMYASYIVDLIASTDAINAIKIAQDDVDTRPTPGTYSQLAWAYYYNKEYSLAASIINEKVLDQTFEPELLYKSALILAANNENRAAGKLIKECKEAQFELGPIISEKLMSM